MVHLIEKKKKMKRQKKDLIMGDTSWLLNFAVIGFPKCGTTTLMMHLQNHTEISMFPKEKCELALNQPIQLIHDLYYNLPSSYHNNNNNIIDNNNATNNDNTMNIMDKNVSTYPNLQPPSIHNYKYRAIKCPSNTEKIWAMKHYAKYFPQTDFVIGIRHPVLWYVVSFLVLLRQHGERLFFSYFIICLEMSNEFCVCIFL